MPQRRRIAVVVSALAVGAAAVGAIVGVSAATRSHARPPLVLVSGGKVVSDAALAPIGEPASYHYRLATPAPDLGSDGPVGRLEVPSVDAARVAVMAHAFGLRGPATDTHPGWRIRDGAAQLTLTPVTGGWDVAYAFDTSDNAAGSVPGSPGAVASAPPVVSPPPVVTPPPPVHAPGSTTFERAARNLPPTARAEQIARTLLTNIGVADDSWLATAYESARDSVACSAQPCAEPDVLLMSRTVVLRPTFHSVGVDGVSWNVEIGDNGRIYSVSGLWTTVHTIGRYPLRSVATVFADLAAGVGGSTSRGPIGAREVPGVSPDHVIAPVTVSIDRVTLGYAAVPVAGDRGEVLDIVPTYVFTGRTSAGDPITQTMVAVIAAAAPPPTTAAVVPMSGAGGNTPVRTSSAG